MKSCDSAQNKTFFKYLHNHTEHPGITLHTQWDFLPKIVTFWKLGKMNLRFDEDLPEGPKIARNLVENRKQDNTLGIITNFVDNQFVIFTK